MAKTFQIHLRIQSEVIELLKKEAKDNDISLSELCRRKIKGDPILKRIEFLINNLNKR